MMLTNPEVARGWLEEQLAQLAALRNANTRDETVVVLPIIERTAASALNSVRISFAWTCRAAGPTALLRHDYMGKGATAVGMLVELRARDPDPRRLLDRSVVALSNANPSVLFKFADSASSLPNRSFPP